MGLGGRAQALGRGQRASVGALERMCSSDRLVFLASPVPTPERAVMRLPTSGRSHLGTVPTGRDSASTGIGDDRSLSPAPNQSQSCSSPLHPEAH